MDLILALVLIVGIFASVMFIISAFDPGRPARSNDRFSTQPFVTSASDSTSLGEEIGSALGRAIADSSVSSIESEPRDAAPLHSTASAHSAHSIDATTVLEREDPSDYWAATAHHDSSSEASSHTSSDWSSSDHHHHD